jgi:hypothetical protein
MSHGVRDTSGGSFRTPSVSEGPDRKAAASERGRSLTVAVLKEPQRLPAECVTDPVSPGGTCRNRKMKPTTLCKPRGYDRPSRPASEETGCSFLETGTNLPGRRLSGNVTEVSLTDVAR